MIKIMKKNLIFTLAFIFLVSCTDKINLLLPNEYNLVKTQEVISFPDKVIVYDITNKHIDSTKIKNYPIYNKIADYNSQKWIDFDNLDEKERIRIRLIIKELTERLIEENIKLDDLMSISNNKSQFYFSGIFQEAKGLGSETYNFYDSFSLLDISKSKLYQIKHIKGY